MNIQEVRQKFPQYNDLSDADLAVALHKKFYSDMPFESFSAKIGLSLVDRIPGNVPRQPAQPEQGLSLNPIKNLVRDVETVAALGSGAVAGLVSPVAARIAHATSGPAQTERGPTGGQPDDVEATTRGIQEFLTYRPRSPEAQEALARIGKVFEESKLAGLPPFQTITAASLAAPAARQTGRLLRDIPVPEATPQPAMAGFGAAYSDVPAMRVERAAQLPVPIKLTKGQASRDFDQLKFERETAKTEVGAPLRERSADQNQRITMNFDAWVDQTGAEAGSLRAVGQIVTDAVAERANRAKVEIRNAYVKAEKAGEMREPINVQPLRDYLDSKEPEAINAPVLISAKAKLDKIAKEGTATLNDIEEVRKMVGTLGTKDATNGHFAREIKGVIDSMTEGAGGAEYGRARMLRAKYAKDFENVGVIDRLMSTKPGTSDRAVAYEDVFRHSILNGSLDDVRVVRKTLHLAGPKGEQAWKELQGQTLKHIKEQITAGATPDQRGNPVVSVAKLNNLVRELDKDGKLDFIFTKKGAQQIRDINEIAKDVLTTPAGSQNYSNTASALAAVADTVLMMTTGIPAPVATITKLGVGAAREKKLQNRVQDALQ